MFVPHLRCINECYVNSRISPKRIRLVQRTNHNNFLDEREKNVRYLKSRVHPDS